jgi:hypothetical protein
MWQYAFGKFPESRTALTRFPCAGCLILLAVSSSNVCLQAV